MVFDAHVDTASALDDTASAVLAVNATVFSLMILDVLNNFSTVVGNGVGVSVHRTQSFSTSSVT